jgi:hypothetical protein
VHARDGRRRGARTFYKLVPYGHRGHLCWICVCLNAARLLRSIWADNRVGRRYRVDTTAGRRVLPTTTQAMCANTNA